MISNPQGKGYRLKFLPAKVDVQRREDGTLVLRSPEPLGTYPRSVGEHLEGWAERTPDAVFLAQRQGDGWRRLTYGEARRRVHAIATSLLRRNLGTDHPIARIHQPRTIATSGRGSD